MILHNIWKYGYFKMNLDAQHTEWHCAWFMTIKWRSCILHYSCETCGLNEAWSYRSNTHSFVCWCGGTEHIGLAASFLLRHWTVSSKTRCFSIRMTVITCFGSRQSFWGSLRSFWPTISSELISDFAVLLTNAELQLNKNTPRSTVDQMHLQKWLNSCKITYSNSLKITTHCVCCVLCVPCV